MAYSVSKIAFMSFFLGSSGFAQTLEDYGSSTGLTCLNPHFTMPQPIAFTFPR